MDLSTLMPQQRDIVTTLDRPLFVSAGAGSGKTFTLTRRILWALSSESGPFVEHLDQVLAITFTKDAAAEIRERVRGALIEAGMDEEALGVDDAWISTIHGMCSRILRAHALELGIDPEFQLIEGAAADTLLDQAVEHVLARVGAGRRGDERPAALSFDALLSWYPLHGEASPTGRETGTSVAQLVRRLLELSSSLPNGLDDVHFAAGSLDMSSLADAYRPCLEASAGAAETARVALDAIDTFEASEKTYLDLCACMLACGMPRPSKAFSKEQVALLKAEAADTFINAMVACGRPATEQLMALAREVEAEYRALKDERSVLDNNDLLRRTHEALRTHESIREAYAGRFKMVMIDEFQDTDQQQVDLISCLTGEDGRALCTVGDAQQSIYRFRGADVEVFRRQERSIAQAAAAGGDGAGGTIVKLVRNFRSHAQILEYVAQVFDGSQGGLMRDFLDLEAHDGRRDALVAQGASRRQAIFVAGGKTEERRAAKAQAIARRFRALADAGQPVGDMVLLLGGMTYAGVYADAFRAQGLDCVISGGSVFASAPEVAAVRALVAALANPADTASGLSLLLASPVFALGVQEFMALSTICDPQTGETRRRNLDAGIASDDDAPGLAGLPLVRRAREVLRRAFARVGSDSFAAIAHDVVNESGWLNRLSSQGAEGRAVAANVLKALDVVREAEETLGNAPRQIALEFDTFLAGKEAPGALNEERSAAVRIMTVHASKGLEFPVVAVADCFDVRADDGCARMSRHDGRVDVVALPAAYAGGTAPNGDRIAAADVEKYFKKLYRGTSTFPAWLSSELMDDVCATGSAAESFIQMGEQSLQAALEEKARLLYVAMTRARELLIVAMDSAAGTARKGSTKVPELKFKLESDLTGAVLERILPEGTAALDTDRLVSEGSEPGDYEFVALSDFTYGGRTFEAMAASDDDDAPTSESLPVDGGPLDTFTLVYPKRVETRLAPAAPAPRDSYSYSSMAAALHEEAEDRNEELPCARDLEDDPELEEPIDVTAAALALDPFALGSAFHAAAQWLIETNSARVPAERADALARLWKLSPEQRVRLDAALALWETSDVRAELLSWPRVQAEVPFYSLGIDDGGVRERFGRYAEGAIDALATDPADRSRALVIDYKTGGSDAESVDELQKKHALQAKVYADVLHRAGFRDVTLKFVRVEREDAAAPGQPQVVTYRLTAGC